MCRSSDGPRGPGSCIPTPATRPAPGAPPSDSPPPGPEPESHSAWAPAPSLALFARPGPQTWTGSAPRATPHPDPPAAAVPRAAQVLLGGRARLRSRAPEVHPRDGHPPTSAGLRRGPLPRGGPVPTGPAPSRLGAQAPRAREPPGPAGPFRRTTRGVPPRPDAGGCVRVFSRARRGPCFDLLYSYRGSGCLWVGDERGVGVGAGNLGAPARAAWGYGWRSGPGTRCADTGTETGRRGGRDVNVGFWNEG